MKTIQDMVHQEISCCLSSLISTLAAGDAHPGTDLAELCDRALGLAEPVPDYEEAAIQAGWIVKAGTLQARGLWRAVKNNAATDDDVTVWCQSDHDAWEAACQMDNIDPIDSEVYEHWAVSGWLAEKLLALGEKVDTDFAAMNVWARQTTGQQISADGVIARIYADMMAPRDSMGNRLDGQPDAEA